MPRVRWRHLFSSATATIPRSLAPVPLSVTAIILTPTACPAKESLVPPFTKKLNDQLLAEACRTRTTIGDEGESDNAPPAGGGAL